MDDDQNLNLVLIYAPETYTMHLVEARRNTMCQETVTLWQASRCLHAACTRHFPHLCPRWPFGAAGSLVGLVIAWVTRLNHGVEADMKIATGD
jgi:hypothetical protein